MPSKSAKGGRGVGIVGWHSYGNVAWHSFGALAKRCGRRGSGRRVARRGHGGQATDDVHPTFIQSFQDSLKHEAFKSPPLDWTKALRIVSKVRSLQELGDYWRLLWELAAACPVPYVSENAVPKRLIAEDQKRLLAHNFAVVVDGIHIYKPVNLKGNPGGYTTFAIHEQSMIVYAKPLKFRGYIVVQDGASLRPDELRGIMIRIKNAAIGYYDPSMLDYRINEGPRATVG